MIEESASLERSSESEEPNQPRSRLKPVWKTGRKRGRSRLRKTASRYFGYCCFRVAHAVVSRLPWSAGRALSRILGAGAYCILRREREIALQSLSRVYGAEKSPVQIRRMTRGVFLHAASVIVDWVILRRWSRARLEARFPEVAASVRQVASDWRQHEGAGVVALGGHLGNWELLAMFFSHFAPGLIVPVAKRLYFEKYNAFLHKLRGDLGLEIIYSDESARKMIRALKSGKVLSLLCDQDLRTNSGVFVNFFGLPAYTATFPVDIARKTGALMATCVLVKSGRGFRISHRFPYEIPRTADEAADVLAATQTWTSILEEEIRKCPEQWSWIHPRWRSTPEQPRLHVAAKQKKRQED